MAAGPIGRMIGFAAAVAARFTLSRASQFPAVVPAVHSFTASSTDYFVLPHDLRIVVDGEVAGQSDHDGMTLIPPSLLSFAQTFAKDMQGVFPGVKATVSEGDARSGGHIFMSILSKEQAAMFRLAKGSPTSEGYRMKISGSGVTLEGSGARGSFWGTRTLLQGLVLNGMKLPAGIVMDQPDWETRGLMLDVGRQWYPISFLTDLCAYASWFKTSEFHVHLSDNLGVGDTTYARFRLRPESAVLAGLTPHLNETYSRQEFTSFQSQCAARGVTVVPEIEAPGHALVITQWKPELAIPSEPSLINLTVPDAIPTIKSIWQEFLPWFHSRQVSIGADEYDSRLANDYNNYVNDMSDFIGQQSNKSIRIWGTNEPSNTTSVSKSITIQHWEFFEDDPYALIRQNYTVINSDDAFNYIVMKYSGSYPQRLNQTRLWNGANVNAGGIWDPHIFDRGNASNNPAVEAGRLQGSIMAIWNDHGPTASTVLEAFYALKGGLPVTVSAGWQTASRSGHLTQAQFDSSYPALEAAAPGQNLDRRIASKGSIVLEYHLTYDSGGVILDHSGNSYNGNMSGGVVSTPLGSKGHNYTLLVNISSSYTPNILLTGPDNSFGFTSYGNGTTLSFTSSNITFPLFNYTLPTAAASPWREIVIIGTEITTSVFVDGSFAGDFLTYLDGTQVTGPMSFVAPLQQILADGRFVADFVVWNGIQDIGRVSNLHQKVV